MQPNGKCDKNGQLKQKPWMSNVILNFYCHFVLLCIISNLVGKVWHCPMKLWVSFAWNLFIRWQVNKFCPARMCYLLMTCKQVVDLLVPTYYVLAIADIGKKERNYLISSKGLTVIHVLEPLFVNHYLWKLDGDPRLMTECFQVSQDFIQKINNFMPDKTNTFLRCFYENQNGKVMARVRQVRAWHNLELQPTTGNGNSCKIDSILKQAAKIKESMMTNIVANVQA